MTTTERATFPNEDCLAQFLGSAKRCAGRSIVTDAHGFDKTYNELIADILHTREMMRQHLPPSALDERGMLRSDAPHVCILTRAGYELVVAFFAIRAMSGSCVPLGCGVLPEEAAYFIEVSKASCVLVGQGFLDRAQEAAAIVEKQSDLRVVSLAVSTNASPVPEIDVELEDGPALDLSRPGLVIFTSGTTGKPKGVVLSRRMMSMTPDAPIGSETISFRASHWLGGFMTMTLAPTNGTRVHILGEGPSAEEVWDVMLKNPINSISFNPWLLRTMKEYLESQSAPEQERLLSCFKLFKYLEIASATPSPSVIKFWQSRTGLVFVNLYASTELGSVALVKIRLDPEKTNCIGVPMNEGIQVKLTEGDKGELLVKTPYAFCSYLGSEEATKAAFDEEGYYRTGDYAEFRDGEYYFCGRASADYIFSLGGLFVPAVQVEMALSSLPYISSACVLGVPDHEIKEICAAVVRLTPDAATGPSREKITLSSICADLDPLLPRYMHPRVLRIIDTEEEMPQTVSQKPIKRLVIEKFFGVDGYWDEENPRPAEGVEWRENAQMHVKAETRPWDWGGLTVSTKAST